MYQRRTGRKQEAGPDGVLELADDCRYAVVKPRQKFVVICHCENQSLEKELTNPCLYVLYKVEKQENSTPGVDSLSSV